MVVLHELYGPLENIVETCVYFTVGGFPHVGNPRPFSNIASYVVAS